MDINPPIINISEQKSLENALKNAEREEKKKLRDIEEKKKKIKRAGKKILFWAVVAISAILLTKFIINQFPKGPDLSQAIPIIGRDHIVEGAPHPDYNSNPPTSGWHYSEAAPAGFYERELTDEQLVHNLEHGHVWISYRSALPAEAIKILKKTAGGNVIATLRDKNDTDIALTSWGRLDKFNLENNSLDEQRVRNFILRYRNRGPEKVNAPRGFSP